MSNIINADRLAKHINIQNKLFRTMLGHYTLTKYTSKQRPFLASKYPSLCVDVSDNFIKDFLYYLKHIKSRKSTTEILEQVKQKLEELNGEKEIFIN